MEPPVQIAEVAPAVLPAEWLSHEAPPLEVDFGCHRGLFLIGMAQRYPDINFLGIERQPARVARCLAKIARLGLSNAHAVSGEGTLILRELLPDSCVDVLHVSFPDPWPKRRHASRRLVDASFLAEVRRILRSDGSLRIMTDDESYFDAICQLTASGWREIDWENGRDHVHTSFEKRFLALGRSPFRRALQPSR